MTSCPTSLEDWRSGLGGLWHAIRSSPPIGRRAKYGVPGGNRTHNRLLRRQVLYPVELRGRKARSANWRHFAAIAAFFRETRCWWCPTKRIRTSPGSACLRQGFGEQFRICIRFKIGGADGDQTHDLVVANDALYQLSYCPEQEGKLVNDAFSRVKQNFPRAASRSDDGG